MDELTELERLAKRAEAGEEAEAAERREEDEPEQQPEQGAPEPGQVRAGENRAEVVLRIIEGGAKLIFDDRLALEPDQVEEGREKLGPAIAKHDLQGTGTGNIPYQEEVVAGFFIGGLIKRLIRKFKALRQRDREEKQKEQESKLHGTEPQYQTAEPAQPVSSQKRVREESDVAAPVVGA